MNALNDLRVRLALWIGGPTVRKWRDRNAMVERTSLDDLARMLGFRDYASLEACARERREASNPERGQRRTQAWFSQEEEQRRVDAIVREVGGRGEREAFTRANKESAEANFGRDGGA